MSIADKYTAFSKAFQDMQILDIGLWQQLDKDQSNWTGIYTPVMKADVANVRRNGFPNQANAIESFWSDPQAWNYEIQLANGAANGVKKSVGGVGNAAGAVGQVGANVGNDVAQGLASAFDMSSLISAIVNKNTWLRIGEGLMGILLLGIGISIMAKSTSVGRSTIKAGKAVRKVVPK